MQGEGGGHPGIPLPEQNFPPSPEQERKTTTPAFPKKLIYNVDKNKERDLNYNVDMN